MQCESRISVFSVLRAVDPNNSGSIRKYRISVRKGRISVFGAIGAAESNTQNLHGDILGCVIHNYRSQVPRNGRLSCSVADDRVQWPTIVFSDAISLNHETMCQTAGWWPAVCK